MGSKKTISISFPQAPSHPPCPKLLKHLLVFGFLYPSLLEDRGPELPQALNTWMRH